MSSIHLSWCYLLDSSHSHTYFPGRSSQRQHQSSGLNLGHWSCEAVTLPVLNRYLLFQTWHPTLHTPPTISSCNKQHPISTTYTPNSVPNIKYKPQKLIFNLYTIPHNLKSLAWTTRSLIVFWLSTLEKQSYYWCWNQNVYSVFFQRHFQIPIAVFCYMQLCFNAFLIFPNNRVFYSTRLFLND